MTYRSVTGWAALVLVAGTALVTLTAACGGESDADSDFRSGASRAVPVTGGSKMERGFVERYVRRIRAPQIIDVQISTAAKPRKTIWKNRPALWLTFTTPDVKPDPVVYIRGQWQAMLLAGAVRDRWTAGMRAIRPVAGYSFKRLVAGKHRVTDASVPVRYRPQRSPAPAGVDEVRQTIEARAPDLRLEIEHLDFERTLGVAPIITIQVDDPADFVRTLDEKVGKLVGDLLTPGRIEGVYIEGRSGEEIVEATVFARRLNTSTGWVNPKYKGEG